MNLQKLKGKQNKPFTFRRILKSIQYSVEGLIYAYGNELSLILHGIATTVVVIIGIILQISFMNWVVILLASAVLLSIELLNTAVEAIVDMFTSEFHEKAKIAKDCGSAAAFVTSIAFGAICGFIFINRLIEIIG